MQKRVERRTGGQILAECLRLNGVRAAFCVPGESYLPLMDGLADMPEDIRLIVCRQEGGAANMAEAYGKLTGRPGVCLVTRGPGATNASIGVHTARQDSTPMVLLIGQVARTMRDREAFQEVDFATMFAPLTKWSAEIDDVNRIPEYVHRAFHIAMSGRPGPVALALPEDMLAELADADLELGIPARRASAAPRTDRMAELARMLAAAERPLLIVGGGGWTEATARHLARFADRTGVPVAASLRCQDYLDNHHPAYIGHLSIGAEPSLTARLRESDLLIVLGARLGEMTTAGYSLVTPPRPLQRLVHIHADPDELGHVYQPDLAINAGPEEAAEALAAMTPDSGATRWRPWAEAARRDYLASLEPVPQPGRVDLGAVMVHLGQMVDEDAIICSGAGNYTGWVHKHWRFRSYRTQLAPTSGAMGYGVPAAIGAKIVHPDRQVISIAGDGCFLMNGQELATAVQYGHKILFLVVNNGMLGTIRMHQERSYPGRSYGTDLVNPDFAALARAYGLWAGRVEDTADFAAQLQHALAAPTSALIELVTDRDALSVRTSLTALRQAARDSDAATSSAEE